MKVRRLIFIVALSIVFIGSGALWQKYTSQKYGFSILLPRFWYKEEGRYNTVIMALSSQEDKTDKFRENITVVVSYIPTNMDLATYFAINKDEVMKTIPGDEFGVEEREIAAGTNVGRLLILSSQAEGIIFRIMSAVWVKENRAYVVTGTSEDSEFYKYEPIFKKTLSSFRIK